MSKMKFFNGDQTFVFLRKSFKTDMIAQSSKPEEHRLEIPKQFFQFKVVLLGESAVGKSCLVVRFVKEFFNEYEDSTVGAAFQTKLVELPKCTVKLDIWDTAGAEQFHVLAPLYYKRAQAAIIVYDVTNRDSFEKVIFWIKELRMANGVNTVALVGNKNDMDIERKVEYEEGQTLAKSHDFLFCETSAKTGFGVETLFKTVARRLTMLDLSDEEDADEIAEVKDGCGCCKFF